MVEVAGPQPYRFGELIRYGLSDDDPRHVVADPDAQYFGTTLTNGSLLPGEHAQLGETRFEDSSARRCSSSSWWWWSPLVALTVLVSLIAAVLATHALLDIAPHRLIAAIRRSHPAR